jgi:hypothetical protein
VDAGDGAFYRLLGGNVTAFAIDEVTGQLKTLMVLDFETQGNLTWEVVIEVRDRLTGAAEVLRDVIKVNITIMDANDGVWQWSDAAASCAMSHVTCRGVMQHRYSTR